MVRRRKKIDRRTVLLVAGALLTISLVGFAIARRDNNTDQGPINGTSGSLAPATTEEKQEAENRKDQIAQEQNNQSSSSTSGIKNVTVVITEANSTSVKGYIQGVFEDGGTCTATATKNSQTITKTSSGSDNVSYTQCTPINWSSPLSTGSWTINLAYKSAAVQGNTGKTIEVK